jgi:alpha-beta hydrolase superfamily lysophospholipase
MVQPLKVSPFQWCGFRQKWDTQVTFWGGQAPEPVLAFHGGLACKETMLDICREAAHLGADCYAVDLPGHGASEETIRLLPNGGEAGCSSMAAWVSRTRKALALRTGSSPSVVGHSLGAELAWIDGQVCGEPAETGRPTPAYIGGAYDCSSAIEGTVHWRLGLPYEPGYLLSHVLEPWDPWTNQAVLSELDLTPGPGFWTSGGRVSVRWLL